MKMQKIAISAVLLAGFGAACGGSSNGALNRHVSAGHMAPVSPEARTSESDAQREYFLAEWQAAFTESQIRATKLDIDIAKNDLASAKLAVKNAALELRAAEDGNDQNAIAKMQQAEKVAHLNVEVQKLKIARAKQSKAYLEKRLAHEKRALLRVEASFELARAESLTEAGVKPPNFDAKKYKAQHTSRVASAKETKAAVDTEKGKLADIEKQLLAAQNKALAAEGKPLVAPAPQESTPMEPLESDAEGAPPQPQDENSSEGEEGAPPEDESPPQGEDGAPPESATPEEPAAPEAAEPPQDATPAASPKSTTEKEAKQ